MILDHINDMAAICARHGVKTALISPGSRSAPLTLAFARHPDIDTLVIPDERSAAFIALGMAQIQKRPVVLICTSGSAACHYAPAIAEAFFQQVPLLVLTADRPPEWIDQFDGQTIRQSGIYGNHVKASFDFPDNPTHPDIRWHANRQVNEALLQTMNEPLGPVHINVPLREPFYPDVDEQTFFRKTPLIKQPEKSLQLREEAWDALPGEWHDCQKKLLVAGQMERDSAMAEALNAFSTKYQTPVINEVISNLHSLENSIFHQDAFLTANPDSGHEALIPHLLITFGKSNISKNLKHFLRKHKPKVHWHIQPHERYQDTFQSVTRIIPMNPLNFFPELAKRLGQAGESGHYLNEWKQRDWKVAWGLANFLDEQPFGEFQAVRLVMDKLPIGSHLHLANSMAVRYANFVGLRGKDSISVWCNRGTSGIDGSNSTATGAALAQGKTVTLITGDMAFFYDRNAFWHNYQTPNLRIILLNNHGGGIFRMIKGPSDQPEFEEYFETKQALDASNLAKEFGFAYQRCTGEKELRAGLQSFFNPGETTKILEVSTSSLTNAKILEGYRTAVLKL